MRCTNCGEPIRRDATLAGEAGGWVHETPGACVNPDPGTSQAPPTPTPMLEAALIMREMFTSYLEAGFSEYQACIICGVWMSSMSRGRPEGD